jgi:hypothetical protein
MNDLEHRIAAAMTAVAEMTDTTRVPVLDDSPVRRPLRRRVRIFLACLGGVAIPLGGLTVASEAGLLPTAAQRAFPWEGSPTDSFGIDLKTARKVADVAGPAGQRLELWVGKAKPPHICTTVFLAEAATPDQPEAPFSVACYGHKDFTALGSVLDDNINGPIHLFAFGAGRSVRGTITYADGRSEPVAVAGGVFLGWIATADLHAVGTTGLASDRVTFTGYDTSGHKVGAFSTYLH